MTEKPKLKIVEVDRTSLADIPGLMLNVAADIEAGLYPDCDFIVAIMVSRSANGKATPFAWGHADRLEVLGAIEDAKQVILNGAR